MKRTLPQSYEELLRSHYGGVKGLSIGRLLGRDESILFSYGKPLNEERHVVKATRAKVATSFDNGEILVQQVPKTDQEYVVPRAEEGEAFEEYVIGQWEGVQESSVDVPGAVSPQFEPDATQECRVDVLRPLETATPSGRLTQAEMTSIPVTSSPEPAVAADAAGKTESDNEFIADMQSILTGKKVFDPRTGKTVEKETLDLQELARQPGGAERSPRQPENPHAIFDRIAQSMQYANAYDLGTIEMEKRFGDFDRMMDSENQGAGNGSSGHQTRKPEEKPLPSAKQNDEPSESAEFLRDLDLIRQNERSITDKAPGIGAVAEPVRPESRVPGPTGSVSEPCQPSGSNVAGEKPAAANPSASCCPDPGATDHNKPQNLPSLQ